MVNDQNQPERPRTEPEIIPPDHSASRGGNPTGQPTWQTTWQTGWNPNGTWRTQRVFVMRPGPISSALLLLSLLLIVGAVALTVIGAFLIWIPVVVLFVAAAAIYRFLRR
jgi:fatty acid desaturase